MTTNANETNASSSSSNYTTVLTSLLPPSNPHVPLSLPTSPSKPHIPSSHISSLSLHPVLEATLHILNLDLASAHFLARHMQSTPRWGGMYVHALVHRIEGDLENARAWYSDVAGTKEEHDAEEDDDAERKRREGREMVSSVWGFDVDVVKDLDLDHISQNHEVFRVERNGDSRSRDTWDLTRSPMKKLGVWSFLDRLEKLRDSTIGRSGKIVSILRDRQQQLSRDSMEIELLALSKMSQVEIMRFLKYCEKKYGTRPYSVQEVEKEVWISMAQKHGDQAAKMITGGEGWREF